MLRTLQRLLFPVLNALGPLLLILAIAMMVPLLIALRNHETTVPKFLISIAICICSGVLLFFSTKRYRSELHIRNGFLLVTLSWFSAVLFSSIPFTLLLPDVSYHRIFFETMSCLTTTGATSLNGLDALPLSLNYWRCLLSWLGGMGIIVLAVAVLPLLGVGGAQLFKAENSNLFKDTKLTPRIADTAKALYSIYILFSVCCAVAYHWAGMSWDDAVLFTFTTVSLSGISPYDQSIGHFNSIAIEMVAVFFIVFSGFNFSLHFTAWRQRSIWAYFSDVEAKAWIFMIICGSAVVFAGLTFNHFYPDWQTTLRHSLFTVASLFSTTGYTTVDYSQWPMSFGYFLLFCSLFASCSGSTGGGVKMIRMLIVIKKGLLSLETLLRPRDYLPLRVGQIEISDKITSTVFAFFALHVLVVFISSFIIAMTGVDFTSAFSTVLACIANTGPGLGEVGPTANYASSNPVQLWIGSFCMFVGRLELFSVFVLFTRTFWRN